MFTVVEATIPEERQSTPVDWTKCVLCQQDTAEKLTDPSQNPRGEGDGYEMLATNLGKFYDIGALPFALEISKLDDGSGRKNTMSKNKACWHKSCYLKCNNTKLMRAEAKYRQHHSLDPQVASPVKTRRKCSTDYQPNTCLFCESPGTKANPLRKVQTKKCDEYIREKAKELRDTKLTSKVSDRCDLISLEAEYHRNCYTRFRNRVRDHDNPSKKENSFARQIKALAFAGLVSYINEFKDGEVDFRPAFSMTQLTKLHAEGMRELGLQCDVHSTRLKERLLEECPFLEAHDKPGVETLLSFRTDVDCAVRSLCSRDYDVESRALCDAAEVVRADIFRCRDTTEAAVPVVSGSATPASVLALVKMIINGPCSSSTTEHGGEDSDQVAVSIAQLLAFHAVKHRKKAARRHNRKQETPMPVYLAMKLYGETRKKNLVDLTYQLGVSISYDRLNTILTQKANEVCSFYSKEGVVCPPSLVRGVFTTSAVDNVDHNTSSTTAMSAFHGTAISLMQHFHPGQSGEKQIIPSLDHDDLRKRSVMELPLDYAAVQPCFVDVKSAKCTTSEMCTIGNDSEDSPFSEEYPWLQKTVTGECAPWGAYHAELDCTTDHHKTVTALLPLFAEQAHSAAMMVHTMNVVEKAIKHLNPNQTPVVVADQPLFALLKQIQFTFPATHGEHKFFLLMGGLHIEMAALRVVGQWLKDSGWVNALVLAGVTTQGRAESLITAGHVTRTRYAHQVTVAVLFGLQQNAYSEYAEAAEDTTPMTFEEWRSAKCKEIPHFKYWDVTMHLQLLVLQFVRSVRTADFSLYVKSLRRLVPWFFALDHVNYARWVSVHIRDLACVWETHPDLAKEFHSGLFTARKSDKPFSGMALDQAHEQLNALIKGDGGMVGLTESPDSLRKWMIAGPELAATVQNFEREVLHLDGEKPSPHHSQCASAQQRFLRDVRKLEEVLIEMGNPFVEHSSDLYNIDSKRVAISEVAQTVMIVETVGEAQYHQFIDERLRTSTKQLMDPIKQNKLPLFSTASRTVKCKTKTKLLGLKNDCSLFSKMYIATSEHRSGDLDAFFEHENQPCPPSISQCGELRSCTKSDLVKCLVEWSPDSATQDAAPPVHAKILDGPAVVHMLSPGQSKTFQDYVDRVFLPFAKKELASVQRVDFVWDRYHPESLKNSTRERRGDGVRVRVAPTTRIPKSWPSFLRDSANKEELFRLLATHISSLTEEGKEVCSTMDLSVVTTSGRDTLGHLSPCNHEEADTRMMVHVADAVAHGMTKVLVRTVDTDVLAIAINCAPKVVGLEELWVHLGTGKHHRYLAAHSIAASLGPEMSQALPMFHAFSGCDTVSSFGGKGKKSAFDAWKAYPEATIGFIAATEGDMDRAMGYIEKYVVTLYDRSSTTSSVNECRKILFTKKDRQLENIPPTLDALKQHSLRAAYQGGQVWGQSLKRHQELPSPSSWGWEKTEEGWAPVWTTLPVASKACLELVRCRCKQGCGGSRCNCVKRNLKCTDLCLCSGECAN